VSRRFPPPSSQRILLSRDQERREHAYEQPVKAVDDVALENHPEIGPVSEHEARGDEDNRPFVVKTPTGKRPRMNPALSTTSARFAPWVTDTGIWITIRQPRTRRRQPA
jgi:hypothetical protein